MIINIKIVFIISIIVNNIIIIIIIIINIITILYTQTAKDAVHGASFYPDGNNNSILITYGAKHIYFWKIFYDVASKKGAKILRDRNSGIFEVCVLFWFYLIHFTIIFTSITMSNKSTPNDRDILRFAIVFYGVFSFINTCLNIRFILVHMVTFL